MTHSRYIVRRQLGVCVQCCAPPMPGRAKCLKCAAEASRANKRRYEERDRSKCVRVGCERKARPGRVMCEPCAAKWAHYMRERTQRQRHQAHDERPAA